jgi:hypothetical protein
MNKFDSVPDVVPLDDESVFCLSIARACLNGFPSTLRKHARLNSGRLHLALESKEISPYGLVSAAYIGVSPLPCTYGRFITQADRINREEPHAQASAFRKAPVERENSAAGEYRMSRQELKRLLKHLDAFAAKFAAVPSYEALFNCESEILSDQSASAPADREAYAEGPLYLWDFVKAVEEYKLVDMSFGTFRGWVLFVHLENGTVSGHAVHPRALRLGNFVGNPLIDLDGLRLSGGPHPILDVPKEVQAATHELANHRFPDRPFRFVPPPLAFVGGVYSSKPVLLDFRRSGAEV